MKLFGTLRQNFIKEGNIKRYLIYAIGKIFAVMIGISLAFQLYNWNENRLKKDEEARYYENIKEQISSDKTLILEQKMFNNFYMDQFKYAREILEANDKSKIDTLGLIVRNLTQYSDFDRQGNIYETMVNSGKIKILRNHKIVNGIRNLEEKYIFINRMENIHYDVMMKHVVGVLNPVIKYATAEIKKPDIVFNYKFENLLTILLQVMSEKNKVYDEGIDEINKTTNLIIEELGTHN